MNVLMAWISRYLLAGTVAACAALLAWGGVQTYRLQGAQKQTAQAAAEFAAYRSSVAESALREQARRRAEEDRQAQARKELDRENERLVASATAAAAGAATADAGLRNAARVAAATCRGGVPADPATAAPSPADGLADVLGSCATGYRDMAARLDRAIIAGRRCEAEHDALMPAP